MKRGMRREAIVVSTRARATDEHQSRNVNALAWESITPLGWPVDPDVNRIYARSSPSRAGRRGEGVSSETTSLQRASSAEFADGRAGPRRDVLRASPEAAASGWLRPGSTGATAARAHAGGEQAPARRRPRRP